MLHWGRLVVEANDTCHEVVDRGNVVIDLDKWLQLYHSSGTATFVLHALLPHIEQRAQQSRKSQQHGVSQALTLRDLPTEKKKV